MVVVQQGGEPKPVPSGDRKLADRQRLCGSVAETAAQRTKKGGTYGLGGRHVLKQQGNKASYKRGGKG